MSRSMSKTNIKPRSRRTYTAAEDRVLAKLRAADGFVPFQGLSPVEMKAFCALTKRGLARFEAGLAPGYLLIGD